jgi:hypothetical protein
LRGVTGWTIFMITILDFNLLDEQGKADALWEGTFLSDRFNGQQHIQLYNLSSFFVEVFYDAERNSITGFRAFSSTKNLDPYLGRLRFQ